MIRIILLLGYFRSRVSGLLVGKCWEVKEERDIVGNEKEKLRWF